MPNRNPGWAKFQPKVEKDLPENLNTRRMKPGDPDYPCEHKVQVVDVRGMGRVQRCLACGFEFPVEY